MRSDRNNSGLHSRALLNRSIAAVNCLHVKALTCQYGLKSVRNRDFVIGDEDSRPLLIIQQCTVIRRGPQQQPSAPKQIKRMNSR